MNGRIGESLWLSHSPILRFLLIVSVVDSSFFMLGVC